jgi:hypothetical protein
VAIPAELVGGLDQVRSAAAEDLNGLLDLWYAHRSADHTRAAATVCLTRTMLASDASRNDILILLGLAVERLCEP